MNTHVMLQGALCHCVHGERLQTKRQRCLPSLQAFRVVVTSRLVDVTSAIPDLQEYPC